MHLILTLDLLVRERHRLQIRKLLEFVREFGRVYPRNGFKAANESANWIHGMLDVTSEMRDLDKVVHTELD